MTVFQGIFLGFLIGSIVTMVCVWLAGGSLYGSEIEEVEEEDDGKERDKNKA